MYELIQYIVNKSTPIIERRKYGKSMFTYIKGFKFGNYAIFFGLSDPIQKINITKDELFSLFGQMIKTDNYEVLKRTNEKQKIYAQYTIKYVGKNFK